ncbi:hypothetical protein TI04_13660, partial [Achromatium sp. WMS2]
MVNYLSIKRPKNNPWWFLASIFLSLTGCFDSNNPQDNANKQAPAYTYDSTPKTQPIAATAFIKAQPASS